MKNIQRIRLASKGLAVAPGRIQKGDPWTETLIDLSNQGREQGKQVCLHTHINHAREITWVTKNAANYLFKHGVIVRNQSVLLKGVNNTYEDMSELIKKLSSINIQPVCTYRCSLLTDLYIELPLADQDSQWFLPHSLMYTQYYVYQCDMVKGVEDLRTPLSEIIALDKKIRGTLSGFMMPSFVVDLPGGGGKRLVATHEDYNKTTGIATYRAPGLDGTKGQKLYTYYDPKPIAITELAALSKQKAQALQNGQSLDQLARSTNIKPSAPIPSTLIPMPAVSQDVGRMYMGKDAVKPGTSTAHVPSFYPSNRSPYSGAWPAASMYASSRNEDNATQLA
jgi:lysine 2,3-aminomutase